MEQAYAHQVQYYETDAMAVVHHANYLHWFEEARIDLMARLGYPYDRMEREGLASPVVSVRCAYRSPVRFGETVLVRVVVRALSQAKLTVDYEVIDRKTGQLRATGETRHCFVNGEGRPVSLKKANPAFYTLLAERVEPAQSAENETR